MIKDCAWVPQHRRTRLLLANTSKPIARFSVSRFASYPLSILIGVHHDAGLAPHKASQSAAASRAPSVPSASSCRTVVRSRVTFSIEHSRIARAEIFPDQKKESAVAFLVATVAYF